MNLLCSALLKLYYLALSVDLLKTYYFIGATGGFISLFILWKNRRRLDIHKVQFIENIFYLRLTNISDKSMSFKPRIDVSYIKVIFPEDVTENCNIQYKINNDDSLKIAACQTKNFGGEANHKIQHINSFYFKITIYPHQTSRKVIYCRAQYINTRIGCVRFYWERFWFKRSVWYRNHKANVINKQIKQDSL